MVFLTAPFQNSSVMRFTLPLCNVCVQDGGKALQEAMSHNTSLIECDICLTEVDEQSASFIIQVVRTNQGLKHETR